MFAVLLGMAAKAFAAETGNTIEKSPRLQFTNVKIERYVPVEQGHKMQFDINVTKSTGYFEINYGGQIVLSGNVETAGNGSLPLSEQQSDVKDEELKLKSQDVYQELRRRGYNFGPQYQLLQAANDDGKTIFRNYREFSTNRLNCYYRECGEDLQSVWL